ncbi:signal peptide peptidase SppA [Terrarubrum flagellatum]|uniref:signal peptide peptidase SppA n=1 Tax=Terrirubrum flagellatum TaxID=2895980 RepID=UPI0031450FC6
MSMTADSILDRRRLRRSLTRWRVLAILAIILAVGVGGYAFMRRAGVSTAVNHIARVTISGFISGDRDTLTMLEDIGKSQASAVVLTIDSPGGTAAGAEALYNGIRDLAAKKPTVAVVQTIAASGGYIAAIGADRIFARRNSFVGSIGVIIQFPDLTKLLDTVGVKVEEVKSSPLKAAPSGLTPTSEEARRALQSLISDSYAWFRDLVRARRGYDEAGVTAVADGRVFTGGQAVANKLVDALGEEKDAIDWLVANRNVAKDLPVRDWRPQRGGSYRFFSVSAAAMRLFGLDQLASMVDRAGLSGETITGGGLLALWRPTMEQ